MGLPHDKYIAVGRTALKDLLRLDFLSQFDKND